MLLVLTIITFVLAAFLIMIDIAIFGMAVFGTGTPSGGALALAFFAGTTLPILLCVVSGVALKKKRAKRFWIPLVIGGLSILVWPVIFVLEWFKIIR